MADEKFAVILRLQTLEKLCGYIGTCDELKSVFFFLEAINEKGYRSSNRNFQYANECQKVYCFYNKRYWRGFVVSKLANLEYLVKLPDIGLIVQVKKWRLVNAHFEISEGQRIQFFRLATWCAFWKNEELQECKLATTRYLRNFLNESIPCRIRSFSPKENFYYVDLFLCRKDDGISVNIAEMLLAGIPCPSLKETKEKYSFSHSLPNGDGLRKVSNFAVDNCKSTNSVDSDRSDQNNNRDNSFCSEPVEEYLISIFKCIRMNSTHSSKGIPNLINHVADKYNISTREVLSIILIHLVKAKARTGLNLIINTALNSSDEVLEACLVAINSGNFSKDDCSFLYEYSSLVLDQKQLCHVSSCIATLLGSNSAENSKISSTRPKDSWTSTLSRNGGGEFWG